MTQPPPPPPGPPDPDAHDRALVARVARGDRTALELLYREHAGWLTARLESRCGDPDTADIALQDTFVAVWRTAKKYQGKGAVGAWLWGIAVRRLIDQLRKRRPEPVPPETIVRHESAQHATNGAAGAANGIDAQLVTQLDHSELGPALADLDPDLQAVLIATAIDGLSTKEAARLLSVPQGTVKTRLMRARCELQAALSGDLP